MSAENLHLCLAERQIKGVERFVRGDKCLVKNKSLRPLSFFRFFATEFRIFDTIAQRRVATGGDRESIGCANILADLSIKLGSRWKPCPAQIKLWRTR